MIFFSKFLILFFIQISYKFLKLLCLSESIEQFMAFYNRYVPHMYSPNVDLMANLLKTIKIYKAINYLPQIYDDIRLLYYIYNMDILQDLLLAMDEIQKSDPLLSKFNQIGRYNDFFILKYSFIFINFQ